MRLTLRGVILYYTTYSVYKQIPIDLVGLMAMRVQDEAPDAARQERRQAPRDGREDVVRLSSPSLVPTTDEERVVQTLLAALRRIRHGSVQIIVQDNRVVQIDTVEKTRLISG